MSEVKPFYKFINEAGDEPNSAELLVFDVIGNWEDMGEVSAKGFARDLAALPSSVKRLDIHINSPGGSVFEAMGIYSRLADHRSDKHVYIDGIAASAASLIAMIGHKIYIRANAQMMIHLPMALAMGNADEMRTVIGALESVTESMINVYAKRTKLDRGKIRSLMADETWFHPEQAVEEKFADEVRGVIKAAAITKNRVIFNGTEFDLSRFHNIPAFTATTQKEDMPNKPKAESDGAGDNPPNEKEEKPSGTEKETKTETEKETKTETQKPAAQSQSYDDGIKAERARIAALQVLDRPATHDIVTKAIADGKTAADIVAECMTAIDKAGGQRDRRIDSSSLDQVPPSDGTETEEKNNKEFGGKIKDAVKNRMKNRGGRVHSRN